VERLLFPPGPAHAHLAQVATAGALLLVPLTMGSLIIQAPLCVPVMF
jgi:hypothetical protein